MGLKNARNAHSRLRVKFKLGEAVIGPGKITLLQYIDEEGGISAAARRLDLTYRRAWHLIDTLNKAAGRPVVETSVGGQGGGGAQLTNFGRELVNRYTEVMERIEEDSDSFLGWLDNECDMD
ncbi:MAG: LysR family transcriptional regulator [Kiloniellales bacterium]|nr:LysR family transcriptional regulator [Kiloniellales bacterium]